MRAHAAAAAAARAKVVNDGGGDITTRRIRARPAASLADDEAFARALQEEEIRAAKPMSESEVTALLLSVSAPLREILDRVEGRD